MDGVAPMSRKILSLLLLMPLTGCQQARSFLHMNSNSPSPFLGFELSVDADDAQQRQNLPEQSRNPVARLTHVSPTLVKLTNSRSPLTDPSRSLLEPTSESRSQDGDLKYSLPSVDLKAGGADSAEVDAIISRFSGS